MTAPRRLWPPFAIAMVLVFGVAGAAYWYAKRTPAGFPTPRLPEITAGITSTPLRAAQGGETPRFRRLGAKDCGIDFTNLLTKPNNYTYLTNGAGLAVGDYDGDGLIDVYLVSQDGPNQLFRQVSPLHFADVTQKAGNVDGGKAWGTGATFADVDGDGDLDLYVCNMEAKNLLYVNQGDGTFREDAKAFGLDICAASTMAAFADYDRDGKLDLYLLTNRALHPGWSLTGEVLAGIRPPADTRTQKGIDLVPTLAQYQQLDELARAGKLQSEADIPPELRDHFLSFRGHRFPAGQPDHLLRSVGGRFVDVTTSAGIQDHGMGLSATWWDYDEDGYPDLYVANDLESPDVLYHNERNGSFRAVTKDVVPHTAYYGMGSDAGDVDGDGHLDLLVADMSMTTHKKAKVLMGDMFEERDVLLHAEPRQGMRNALLLNTGLGAFREAAAIAGVSSTDWTWSVLFGDLDNDARLDLFVTNGIARFDMDPDLKIKVDQLWAEKRTQAAIELIQNVRKVPEKNLALRNTGDLKFQKMFAEWGLDLEAVSHGASLVDLDGDGDLDVIVNNFNEPCAVYENRTTDGNAIAVALKGQRSDRFGVGARVTCQLADGTKLVRENWLSRGYLSGQNPELHFGLGKATKVGLLTVSWPSGHVQQFDNLEAGHRYVVTEPPGVPVPKMRPETRAVLFQPSQAPPFTHQENDFDEFQDQPLLPSCVSTLGPGIACGDCNGDGLDDVFVGGAHGQKGALYLAGKDGGFTLADGPWQADADCEDMAACWLDYDGDGDLDLLVASGGAEVKQGDALLQDRLYRNDGNGHFTKTTGVLPDVRESSGHAAVCDFDGDGDLDLFVAGRLVPGMFPDAPGSHLYRNDGGAFVDATAALAPALATAGMVTCGVFADIDGDQKPDLVLAAHWQPIRYLHQENGAFVDRTADAGLANDIGWWNGLCAVDADGDGDLDLLAGNQGLNTKYKASPDHPAKLFFGDFDDNGHRDLVEAKYEGDTLLPVRGRSCSSQAMPFVAKKFATYEQYASSTLAEIYTPQKLQQSGELTATQLQSCLLRNDGKGHFAVEPLPRRAQLAPIFAMVQVGDLIVCADNSFAPEPETGRHDGSTGLVLRLSKDGVQALEPEEHGICFLGDRKGVVLRRASDGAELLFACNDGPLRAYKVPAGLVVKAAKPGAGSNGYLSQSSAVVTK